MIKYHLHFLCLCLDIDLVETQFYTVLRTEEFVKKIQIPTLQYTGTSYRYLGVHTLTLQYTGISLRCLEVHTFTLQYTGTS